ncbi:MAG TPA: twin-arginine translocation signal domain-containing protein, partial [Methylomirabilota bacterium]
MSADGIDRRGFLRAAGLAGAAALAGVVRPDRLAWAAALTRAERDRMTPDQIIERMKSGNAHFRKGEGSRQNYLAQQRASAKGQYPAAVILSC